MAKQFIKNLVPFSTTFESLKNSLDSAYTLANLTFNNKTIEKPFISSIFLLTDSQTNLIFKLSSTTEK